MLVKICGLQTVQAAEAAIDNGADLLGVICVPNRKRTVSPDVAVRISSLIREKRVKTKLVGVFRNQDVDQVLRVYEQYGLDIVQLHGSEDIAQYRAQIPVDIPLVKAYQFPQDCDKVRDALELENVSVLFDSGEGGTGEVQDWAGIARWSEENCDLSFIIAGGLTPDNVSLAIEQLPHATGVDVSGGVETSGAKDLAKIKSFIRSARAEVVI